MGREIRMVDPDWEHPRYNDHRDEYQPMHEYCFDEKFDEWCNDYKLWRLGKHPDQKEYPENKDDLYWEWAGTPPDPTYYLPRPFKNPTWIQMYETVSEGTPVSPKFETAEGLINYLVENGDFWDQKRGHGGWDRKNAEGFVGRGWSPSGVVKITTEKTEFKAPRDGIQ